MLIFRHSNFCRYKVAPAPIVHSPPVSPKVVANSGGKFGGAESPKRKENESIPAASSSPPAHDVLKEGSNFAGAKTQRLATLEKRLAVIAEGEDSERLAHEICLNPSYRLPDAPATAFIDSLLEHGFSVCTDGFVRSNHYLSYDTNESAPSGLSTAAEVSSSMKRMLLEVIADRMICGLRTSKVSCFQDIAVGDRVAVTTPENPNIRVFMTATIDSLNAEAETINILFLSSKKSELNVKFSRVKQLSDPVDGTQLVSAMMDLRERISSFSNSHQMQPIDDVLLLQMLRHHSITPTEIASTLISALNAPLTQLVAPARSHRLEQWMQRFLKIASLSGSFEEMIPFLPFFFEVTTAFSDELQRDMVRHTSRMNYMLLIRNFQITHTYAYRQITTSLSLPLRFSNTDQSFWPQNSGLDCMASMM